MSDRLTELAGEVVALLRPVIDDANFPKRSTVTGAFMTAFRPYVEAALTGVMPRPAAAREDRRKRLWRLSMEFWRRDGTSDTLVAVSPGRKTDAEGIVVDIGGDVVAGMDTAAELIADYAAGVGAMVPDFQPAHILRALDDLRATISRQGGRATMRRVSSDGTWALVCDVQRES